MKEGDGKGEERKKCTESIRLAIMMLSSTALRTTLSCSVSVAHVNWGSTASVSVPRLRRGKEENLREREADEANCSGRAV